MTPRKLALAAVATVAVMLLVAGLWIVHSWRSGRGIPGQATSSAPMTRAPIGPKLMREPVTGGRYYLFVPRMDQADRPAPLIISCHGTDPFDTAEAHAGEWKVLAEKHGCIVACPKLVGTDGILAGPAKEQLLQDERLILSVVEEVSGAYNVDRRNVMLTGFSGGGLPVYFAGLRHPEVFSVLVARSCNFGGAPATEAIPPAAKSMSVMVYWSRADPGAIVTQSQRAVAQLRSAGLKVTSTVLSGLPGVRSPDTAMGFFLDHLRRGAGSDRATEPN